MTKRLAVPVALVVLSCMHAAAQEPPATSAPVGEYTYREDGRRDPFIRLDGGSPLGPGRRCATGEGGTASVPVSELALRGVVSGPEGRRAVLGDARGRSHFVRVGDRVCGGRVEAIDADRVVFAVDAEALLPAARPHRVERRLHPARGAYVDE